MLNSAEKLNYLINRIYLFCIQINEIDDNDKPLNAELSIIGKL